MQKEPVAREAGKKPGYREWLYLAAVLAAAAVLVAVFPGRREKVASAAGSFLVEMAAVLPAVMILMGIFAVWVPAETVSRYLGKQSGLKGALLSLLFGTLPTGPLYVAFPLAQGLLKKGAGTANVVIFLSAWACIKLPQELVELQFLGAGFMALRLGLTVTLVFLMGWIIEKTMERNRKEDNV